MSSLPRRYDGRLSRLLEPGVFHFMGSVYEDAEVPVAVLVEVVSTHGVPLTLCVTVPGLFGYSARLFRDVVRGSPTEGEYFQNLKTPSDCKPLREAIEHAVEGIRAACAAAALTGSAVGR